MFGVGSTQPTKDNRTGIELNTLFEVKFHKSGGLRLKGSQSDQGKKLRSCTNVGSVSAPTYSGGYGDPPYVSCR